MRCAALLAAAVCAAACGRTSAEAPASTAAPGEPSPELTLAQRESFFEGKHDFVQPERAEDGLGPVFNEASCAACHAGPAVGGASPRAVTRFGAATLLHDHVLDGCGAPEALPVGAAPVLRRTTPLFGLGLVDAIPDEELRALALAQPSEIAGTVSAAIDRVTGLPAAGKFGWKAQTATLFEFAAAAYLDELGVTSPLFPAEHCPGGDCARLSCNPHPQLDDDGAGVSAVTDFMAMLAPPQRGHVGPLEQRGAAVAQAIGCLDCHVRALTTGDHGLAPLRRRVFEPWSDFLLHDMGALGDGLAQGAAGPRQMRTAPLWGLRFQERLLHDGRAGTPEEAIVAHDGQGAGARDRFVALGAADRAALLAFLASL